MRLKNLSVKIKIPKLLKEKLNNKKIYQIYEKFEKSLNIKENFIVAVSGGPDSMALAFLAKIYSIKKNVKTKFFIINHRLRVESDNEAITVKNILKKFSINAQILNWNGKKPTNNIQSNARNKRYELLIRKCLKFSFNNILLGHHQDDLFENFFIRLLRGSGLKGLISLDKKSKVKDINLLRPMINQKKEDLVFISKNVFNFYINDPSNDDEKFQRIKVRNLIKQLEKNGLNKDKFAKTINNLQNSNKTIRFYVNENLKKNTSFLKRENQLLVSSDFFKQPEEIIFRSLSDSLQLIGKSHYSVRGKKLENIISKIKKNNISKVTLGGCIIEKVNETIIIKKEY